MSTAPTPTALARPTATPAAPAAAPPDYPSEKTMKHAVKFAIDGDCPILLDYWRPSLDGEVYIAVTPARPGEKSGDKFLCKSADEYTSCIQSISRCDGNYLIRTENSLYIVREEFTKMRATAAMPDDV